MADIERISFCMSLPPKQLSPNARVHWAAKAKAVREYRQEAALRASATYIPDQPPRWDRARTKVVFNFHRRGRRDRDNHAAMLKSLWDGLVDAGVLVDDAGLSHDFLEFQVDKSIPTGVAVIVSKVAPSE